MKTITCLLLVLFCFYGRGADVRIVAPNNFDTAEGNSTHWPFTFEEFGIGSRRYQQVYDASQFSAIGPQGGYIKELWFREGGRLGAGDTFEFLPSVQINLGVTPRVPDSLSPVFSENIGTAYSTVYGAAPLQVWTAMAAP